LPFGEVRAGHCGPLDLAYPRRLACTPAPTRAILRGIYHLRNPKLGSGVNFGFALMFASMIPIYLLAGGTEATVMRDTLQETASSKYSQDYLGSLIRLRGPCSLRDRDPRVVGVFGVADLACDLGTRA
jgi:hypothetical protein